MDVPFISSGAMSRAQYALVRNVENATSPHAADQVLLKELDVIRRNLQRRHLSIKECKESLILILHCTMSLSNASLSDLEFAFPHAVNLAELGQSVMDKKIGYIFCMELMPPTHELQLMLVNTLRKDLESSSIARMCLALDVLIQVPNEDVIPAIDARLQTLLEHESEAVQRRAQMAYYTLFQRDPERLARLEDVVQRCLWPDTSCVESALTVAGKLENSEALGNILNLRLRRQSSELTSTFSDLRTLRRCGMKLETECVPIVIDIIQRASKIPNRAALRDAFMVLSTVSAETLRGSQLSSTAVSSIRHFLLSRDPNDVFLFVSCLSCLDPSLWAGTHSDTPAVLDEWEVQGVMRLLDSPDGMIRKMTLKILHSVDPTIVGTYYSQALSSLSPLCSLSDKREYVLRLLEILDMQEADDVDQYARRLKELFSVIEGEEHGSTENLPVLDLCVERILSGIRDKTTSRVSCITALAVSLIEPETRVGPTLMVVISALISEYCGKISTSPLELLRGIATRLVCYAPSVQDACLLTMLRLSVECDEVPEQVIEAVRRVSQHASAYLRRRCHQFLTLSSQRRNLADIISRAASSSLPDLLLALTNYQPNSNATPPQPSRTLSTGYEDLVDFSPSRGAGPMRKLRYEAYAAPQPVPSLRHLSSPRRSKGSISSPEGSIRSISRASNASNSLNELGRTITPGELTLTAAAVAASQSPFYSLESGGVQAVEDEMASRVDLIALDSPFMAESRKDESIDVDFEAAWDSMETANARGWCEASLDMVVRLLQSLQYRMRVITSDQPPFEGELKVLVQGPAAGQYATLRLKEGDDESCLWWLRCEDAELRGSIKRLIEGD